MEIGEGGLMMMSCSHGDWGGGRGLMMMSCSRHGDWGGGGVS